MLIPSNWNKLALLLSDESNQEPAGDWVQTLCLDTQGCLASSDLTCMQVCHGALSVQENHKT